MSSTPRLIAVGGFFLALAAALAADDRPALHKPSQAQTRQDLDRREALRLYGLASFHERNNRLVEAVRAFEKAARLDPTSAAIPRALAPLYLALDRADDAFDACKKVLKLDPDDYQTAGLFARHLRTHGMNAESMKVLAAATKSKKLAERPDIAAQVWFDLGQMQQLTGEIKESLASYRKIAAIFDDPASLMEHSRLTREEIDAQAAETYERIGRVSLEVGDADAAAKAFESAQKKDPSRATRLALNLAQVYQGQKKYKEALAQTESYLRTQPQGTEGYELKVSLQRKLGRSADILPDLEASSKADQHNIALRLLLAREYQLAGKARESERVYVGMLEKLVTPEIYKGLFGLYREEGKAGAAKVLARLDKAVKSGFGDDKAPANANDAASARAMIFVLREEKELVKQVLDESIRRLQEDEENSGLAHATRGFLATLAARTKQLDHAEKLYRSCLDKQGGPREMEADVYSGLIRVLRLRYKHESIVEVCTAGLKKAQLTNRLLFHTELGRAYQYLEKHDEAVKTFEVAVREAGKTQLLYCKRLYIDALTAAGSHEKALSECQGLVKEYNQGGDLREARGTLSQVYQSMGKHEEADRQLQLILESDPNDATANNDLGYVWADRNKNLEEAEKLIRKAIEVDRKARTISPATPEGEEDSAAYVDSLGWVLFRRGKLAEAREELEKAVKLPGGDDDPTVWDHLGDVYHRMGEKQKAVGAWKKAASLYEQRTRRMQSDRFKEIQEKIRTAKP